MFRRVVLTSVLFFSFIAIADEKGSGPLVHQLILNDVIIGPATAEYLEEGIEKAEREKAEALLILLDTPGGLLSSTRQIVKGILNADVPIVVYVAPSGARAGSAGVFVTLAAHIAAMAPSTNIGAAHPVSVGGDKPKDDGEGLRELLKSLSRKNEKTKDPQDKKAKPHKDEEARESDPMESKIMNDTIAWVKGIASTRGRNVDWAVKAVTESASITEKKALEMNVVDFVAENEADLLARIDGREVKLPSGPRVLKTKGAAIAVKPMSKRQELLNILINPNIAYILMMLGFYGLLFEITHPGSWIPGIAGAICIILAFYAFHTIPTNYAGLALIIISFLLFVAEAFVASYGLLTLGGVVSLVLGSLFLIDSPLEFMQVSLTVIIPVALATALIATFLVTLAVRAQRQRSETGADGLVGAIGVADTEFSPKGKIFVKGEYWDADAGENVSKGEKLEIISVEGMKLNVKKAR